MDVKVLVMMGVCGTGKSTVARMIADRLRWDFVEGDDLHPASNVSKMASGLALTDEERLPWLQRIARWIRERNLHRRPGIVTCSALKRSYRDVLRSEVADHVIFVHLVGTRKQILDRLSIRVGHFMPASLLDTQMDTLEPIGPDESALVVDIGKPPDEMAADIIDRLALLEPRVHIVN